MFLKIGQILVHQLLLQSDGGRRNHQLLLQGTSYQDSSDAIGQCLTGSGACFNDASPRWRQATVCGVYANLTEIPSDIRNHMSLGITRLNGLPLQEGAVNLLYFVFDFFREHVTCTTVEYREAQTQREQ